MPRTWPKILGLVNPEPDGVDSLNSHLGILPGWVVFHRSMARDAQVYSGDDFRIFTEAEVGVICCLEWDDSEGGTVPAPGLMKPFLQRCQSYVEASFGCHVWIIGNEMNVVSKWPLTVQRADSIDNGENSFLVLEPRYRKDRYPLLSKNSEAEVEEGHFPISPSYYVDCFSQVRECIKSIPNHEQDLVLVGAVAPWNTDARDPENPSGDWIRYFKAVAGALMKDQCEGFALHTATLGPNPENLTSDQRLPFPFGSHKAGFRCFEDFIEGIPEQHRELPVFITEASQLQPWLDANDGWIFRACTLINDYNRIRTQSPIRCLALFQWGPDSPWSMRGKSYLLSDFRETLQMLEDRALKASLCPVTWDRVSAPERIATSGKFDLAVSFSNGSDQILQCSGDDPARLALAFLPERKEAGEESPFPELRYPLPENVSIGGYLTLQFQVQAPQLQGEYQLCLGIVKSQFVWSSTELEGAFTSRASVLDPEVLESLPIEGGSAAPLEPDADKQTPFAISASTDSSSDQETTSTKFHQEAEETDYLELKGAVDKEEDLSATEEEFVAFGRHEEFEILDLTAFIPSGASVGALRHTSALHRIVFTETGLSADTPVDEYQSYFRRQGLEGLPFHYVLENEGPIYKVLSLNASPLAYSQNLARAIVFGLEGRALSLLEAESKLLRAAKAFACVLHSQALFGLSLTWEIGIDSLDGEIPFCGLGQDFLKEIEDAMQEHWRSLGKNSAPLNLTSVELSLESPLDTDLQGFGDSKSLSLAKGTHEATTSSGQLSAIELESEQSPISPLQLASLDSPFSQRLVDLESAAADELRLAYSEKNAITLWSAGEPGNTPVSQLQRIHRLQFGDIIYHFVITSEGEVFETRRSDAPDENLPVPHNASLHIGLLGDFKHQHPTELQTKSCRLLLARLASGHEFSGDTESLDSRVVKIGNEHWFSKEDWRRNLLLEASQLQALLAGGEQAHNETDDYGEIAGDFHPGQERVSQEVSLGLEERIPTLSTSEGQIPKPSLSEEVPRLINKVGALPIHHRMLRPRRQLEAIRGICIHHTDAPGIVGPEQLSQSLILDQNNSEMQLHGLPYHFFVHSDGQIDQCVALDEVCQANESDNTHLISIGLAGKFTGKVNPTPEQLKKTGVLVSWLMKEHFLTLDDIKGHKDMDLGETVCPGDEWSQGKSWKDSLFFFVS